MPVSELFTEVNRIDVIVPASRQAVMVSTGYVSMRDYHKAFALILTGAIAALAVVDAKLVQATDTAGLGAKDVAGKAVTTLDGGDDNSSLGIELDASELDVNNGYDCIALQISCGGGAAAVLCAGALFRTIPRFKPVDASNLAEVVN